MTQISTGVFIFDKSYLNSNNLRALSGETVIKPLKKYDRQRYLFNVTNFLGWGKFLTLCKVFLLLLFIIIIVYSLFFAVSHFDLILEHHSKSSLLQAD